jgi:tRNA (guanosine-2'-O-)-methyltransferase
MRILSKTLLLCAHATFRPPSCSMGWQQGPVPPKRGVGSRYDGVHRPRPKKETWENWEYMSFEKIPPTEGDVEPAEDRAAADDLQRAGREMQALLDGLSNEDLQRAIDSLEEFTQPERQKRLLDVLSKRTVNVAAVFESPSNPNNVWACLRTLDSFGLQHVHFVADPLRYHKKGRLRTMCTAMGSQKWLSLHAHPNAEEAVRKLKKDGYRIVASQVGEGAIPAGQVDWSQKTAFVIGNEESGISPKMKELSDELYYIPMQGFAESYNMAVACTITLTLIQQGGGMLHGNMSPEEQRLTYMRWLMLTCRDGEGVLNRAGIYLPPSLTLKNRPGIAGYSTIKT